MPATQYAIAENTVLQRSVQSRLPDVGLTIFSHMSALAAQHQAVNLGQGFPDFACDPALIDCVRDAMQAGENQYPLMAGVPNLRRAIADKIAALYGSRYDENTEITVTAGATQALFCAIACCVKPGDEVIVIEPAYDSYIPAIKLAGGIVKTVAMRLERDASGVPHYTLPFDALADEITPETRLLILNTPHNPTGTALNAADMLKLQYLLEGTDVLVCSDEVYEHIVFDGARHESVARYPRLAERSFVISSFGKSFHVTGWKVGYVAAPAWLMAEFRKIHQYNVFTVNAPMQHGIARYLEQKKAYLELPEFYQKKRDYFRVGLAATKLRLLPCQGTYFQAADYSTLDRPEAALPEAEFSEWLTREIGVACIPMSAFYTVAGKESRIVRFCFAKQEATLATALERLARL
jgi:methionine aminotransferase